MNIQKSRFERTMISNTTHGYDCQRLKSNRYRIDVEAVVGLNTKYSLANRAQTHLKLAVSIHTHPILTSHRSESANASSGVVVVEFVCKGIDLIAEQGRVLSGARYPLSLANCSKHIGRKSVKDTMTKTSLLQGMVLALRSSV